jgi:hypothetical protein
MTFCCSVFQDSVESAGERGPSVVVIDGGESSPYAFRLQWRATDASQPFTAVTPYPVTTVVTMGIAFCPWCGADLKQFYAARALPLHPELAGGWYAVTQGD